jgi:hypothetical protein
MARKPEGASFASIPLAICTAQLPRFCSSFFSGEKCSISEIGLAPMAICASPATMGAVRAGMQEASY